MLKLLRSVQLLKTLISDTVNVENHSDLVKKYINRNILNQSDYYKNMILKVSEINSLVNNL